MDLRIMLKFQGKKGHFIQENTSEPPKSKNLWSSQKKNPYCLTNLFKLLQKGIGVPNFNKNWSNLAITLEQV